MLVRHDLDFYVPWPFDKALDVNVAVLKSCRRLTRSGLQRVRQLPLRIDDAHAPSTAAAGGFNNDRETNLTRQLFGFALALDGGRAARENRHACFLHRAPGCDLLAH